MSNKTTEGIEKFISAHGQKEDAEIITSFKTIEVVVAFIDILGTSALMERIEHDENEEEMRDTYEKIKGISDLFKNLYGKYFKDDKNSTSNEISDSYVIVTGKENIEKLIEMLSLFQYNVMAKYKEIMRGGISLGKIINDFGHGDRIIGPAFINAHKLEVKVANYPRIIIGKELIEICRDCGENYIIADADEIYYLNFIQNAKQFEKNIDEDDKAVLIYIEEKIKKIDGQKPDEARVKQKYGWLHTLIKTSFNIGESV
jgi:hypothetical protein